MKTRFRISPEGPGREPSDDELRRYRDSGKLIHNYQRARDRLRRPIYRDPKAFLILLLIALVAWLVSQSTGKRTAPATDGIEQHL
jgi:hypothetical protein